MVDVTVRVYRAGPFEQVFDCVDCVGRSDVMSVFKRV